MRQSPGELRREWSPLHICAPLLVTLCILVATLVFLYGVPCMPWTEEGCHYTSVSSLTGQELLKRGLKSLLTDGHHPVTYRSLWDNLAKVDQGRSGCVQDRCMAGTRAATWAVPGERGGIRSGTGRATAISTGARPGHSRGRGVASAGAPVR